MKKQFAVFMEHVQEISEQVSYAIKADAGDPEVIKSLGTRNLDGVVVAVADDMEASVMATLVSKEIGVPYVIAKAKNELHATILKKIGADAVIFPEMEMGVRVAKTLMSSNFADWIALSPDYSRYQNRRRGRSEPRSGKDSAGRYDTHHYRFQLCTGKNVDAVKCEGCGTS